VENIYNSSFDSKIPAVSSGAPGMILSTESPHTCILLAWPVFKNNIPALVDSILEQLVRFSGIDTQVSQSQQDQPIKINHEIAWRIRRHPLFYNPD